MGVPVSNTSTQQRDRATQLAQSDPRGATDLARKIGDPWFRCQALAHVAIHSGDAAVLEEAFAAARELVEPNRHVTVAAWPLKALAVHGDERAVRVESERLLGVIAQEPSPVRRADALRMIFGAVAATHRRIALDVARALAEACSSPLHEGRPNRKGASLLEACLPAIARVDEAFAETVRVQLPPQRAERAQQKIAELQSIPTRELVHWPNLGS